MFIRYDERFPKKEIPKVPIIEEANSADIALLIQPNNVSVFANCLLELVENCSNEIKLELDSDTAQKILSLEEQGYCVSEWMVEGEGGVVVLEMSKAGEKNILVPMKLPEEFFTIILKYLRQGFITEKICMASDQDLSFYMQAS